MRGGLVLGGRGGNFGVKYSRNDCNMFAVLSDQTQDGGTDSSDCEDLFSDTPSANEFQPVDRRRGKRRRQHTGSGGNINSSQAEDETDYDALGLEEKVSLILSKVAMNENRFNRIDCKLDSLARGQKRLKAVEGVLKSYEDRIKLLEYKSIDIEARGRRNNLLFYGFGEMRNEDCREKICNFVCEKFGLRRDAVVIERAHRVGKFMLGKTRPIIVAFRDYVTTENIMSQGRILKGTANSVSRDYPQEVTNARKLLWEELKSIKSQDNQVKVSVGYPAKLIVDNQVVLDLFPEWDSIMKGSRIDGKHPSQQRMRSNDISVNNSTMPSQPLNMTSVNNTTLNRQNSLMNGQLGNGASGGAVSQSGASMPPPPPPPPPPTNVHGFHSGRIESTSGASLVSSATGTSSFDTGVTIGQTAPVSKPGPVRIPPPTIDVQDLQQTSAAKPSENARGRPVAKQNSKGSTSRSQSRSRSVSKSRDKQDAQTPRQTLSQT